MKTLSLKLSLKIPTSPVDSFILSDRSLSKNECSFIIDDIYISGYQYSLNYDYLKQNKFTHIINCAAGSRRFKPTFYEDFHYLALDIKDDPGVNIEKAVEQVINFIESASQDYKDRKILIHCFEGISRGPTVLSSYLMWKYNFDKDTAVDLIKEKRACVEINLGFMCQLEKLNKNTKMTMRN